MSDGFRKVALVTGGARRIGEVISRRLARSGWDVVVHCNSSLAAGQALATDLCSHGARAATVEADLSNRDAVGTLLDRASQPFGPVTLLVNNAAAFERDDLQTVTWESWDKHLAPNLAAPIFLTKRFAELLPEQANGNVVNLLDQKVSNLNPDFLSYTISKVALAGATRMLAMALGPRIRVNGIAPGITLISGKQTQASFEKAWRDTPLGRSSTPEEIADALLSIISLPSLTGQILHLDGGESLASRSRDVAFDVSRHQRSSLVTPED